MCITVNILHAQKSNQIKVGNKVSRGMLCTQWPIKLSFLSVNIGWLLTTYFNFEQRTCLSHQYSLHMMIANDK